MSTKRKDLSPGILMTIFLVIMSCYPPLATDMYLSALPGIAKQFQVSVGIINLTLVLFFIFFAIATLLWGPVSDKYGRKLSLVTGIVLFTLASLGCVVSQTAYQLILFRIIQALGAGAPVTISIAIVQDLYKAEQKKKILAILGALMMVAPVVAPILGSFLNSVYGWRSIFIVLLFLGLISLGGVVFFPETNRSKSEKSFIRSFTGLFVVLKNKFFRKSVFIFSLPAMVVLGFVGGSSAILMDDFGLNSKMFTLFFASNALFAILGSLVYVPLSRRVNGHTMVYWSFAITILSGVLVLFLGKISPAFFMLSIYPVSFATALIRPVGIDIMMGKSGKDAGSASAIINFVFVILGSVSMGIITQEWPLRSFVYALIVLSTGIVCLFLWHILKKSS